MRILPGGEWQEIYNGPGKLAWSNAGKMQRNGQRAISASRLSALMGDVSATDRLPKAVS